MDSKYSNYKNNGNNKVYFLIYLFIVRKKK